MPALMVCHARLGQTAAGLDEAVRLCEEVLSLPDEVFLEAAKLPPGYRPSMHWSVRQEINNIRPRARAFMETAAGRVK